MSLIPVNTLLTVGAVLPNMAGVMDVLVSSSSTVEKSLPNAAVYPEALMHVADGRSTLICSAVKGTHTVYFSSYFTS